MLLSSILSGIAAGPVAIMDAGSMNALAQSSKNLYADFNGDGYADLAIGVASEDVGTLTDAGAVNVIYGSSSGLSASAAQPDQVWTQASAGINGDPEESDLFGFSLAGSDFNGDSYSDLAIGISGENVAGVDAGAVAVIYGSSAGLKASAAGDGTGRSDQLWHQNSPGIEESAEQGNLFGHAVEAGDFNKDGYDDLAIGSPDEGIGAVGSAGAVNVIYGSPSGLSASSARADQLITQSGSDNESGDLLGWSLEAGDFDNDGSDDLAIGVPGEQSDSGAVRILYGSPGGLVTSASSVKIFMQGQDGINDAVESGDSFGRSLEAGDFNGDEYEDLAVGVPLEDIVSSGDNAGAVSVIYGSSSGLSANAAGDGSGMDDQFWHQFDPSEVPMAGSQSDGQVVIQHPAAQQNDEYGSSLAAGDFDGDGNADLAVGVPGESVAGIDEAGSVNMLYGSAGGLQAESPHDQVWHQNTSSVSDSVEAQDRFATSLSAADFNGDGYDDLAIGVPAEDIGARVDAGAVHVTHGSPMTLRATASGSTPDDQFWSQNSPNVNETAETGDLFSFSLAS